MKTTPRTRFDWHKPEDLPEGAIPVIQRKTFSVWIDKERMEITEHPDDPCVMQFDGFFVVPKVRKPSRWQAKKAFQRWAMGALIAGAVAAMENGGKAQEVNPKWKRLAERFDRQERKHTRRCQIG